MRDGGSVGRTAIWFLSRVRVRLHGALNVVIPVGMALLLVSVVEADPHAVPDPVRVIGMAVGVGQGIAPFWRRSHPRTALGATVVS
jgi:hypothetical protein